MHLGLGAFARSHLAAYVDELADPAWPIVGVGLMPGDVALGAALKAQDCDYSLVLRHGDGAIERRTVTAVQDYLLDPAAVLELMTDPRTRIVSLTITEGGYARDAHGRFDPEAPGIAQDLKGSPRTAFGLVVAALQARREAGVAPFTVLSCDNIENNGAVARASFAGYADLVDPELGAWVRDEVAFPSSMVDRITPATTEADRVTYGDPAVVVAEPFRQWVLEDHFPLGRPAFDKVGVQLVDDVRPYELMKLRLLNAGHQAMAYVGVLRGHTMVHEAAADPVVQQVLRDWFVEARPTLDPVPGIDLDGYTEVLLERFANPHIADTLARLCAFASDRIPTFVLPVLRDNLVAGRPIDVAVFVLASWARYLEVAQDVVDQRQLPGGLALLEFLGDLGSLPAVRDPFEAALRRLP